MSRFVFTIIMFGLLTGAGFTQESPKEITNSIGMKLVLIPKGTFQMGSPPSEEFSKDDESQHEVTITESYYLGAFEVTQSQFEQLMGKNPSHFQKEVIGKKIPAKIHPRTGRTIEDAKILPVDSSDFPVEKVSWKDAQEFCRRLSDLPEEKKEGRIYRLPTEAEWERACRGGKNTAFSFGDSPNSFGDHAWFSGNAESQTHPVGMKTANPYGLYDMYGNVREYCSDWYGPYPKTSVTDPVGPKDGDGRVIRGGFFGDDFTRSAEREYKNSDFGEYDLGLRVAMTLSATVADENTPSKKNQNGGSDEMNENDKASSEYGNQATREWVINDAGEKIRGGLIEVGAEKISLRQDDGSVVTVPIDNLSDSDQEFLKSLSMGEKTQNRYEITNSIGMKMRLIPSGQFVMGSPSSEESRDNDEVQHEVAISREFYLGVFEVTQSQYEKVMGENPSRFQGKRFEGDNSNRPVECVTWDNANDFCKRLSELPGEKLAGRIYRLPTEAEWEYACRAGSKSAYYFGDNSKGLRDHAFFFENSNLTNIVGQKKPNAWGFYDLCGNVKEWCADWYGDYPSLAVKDPLGPEQGQLRVFRGGGWTCYPKECRSAARSGLAPSFRSEDFGFRVVMTFSEATK